MTSYQRWVAARYFDQFKVPDGYHHIRGWGGIRVHQGDIFEYEATAMGYEIGAVRLAGHSSEYHFIERGYLEPEEARSYAGRECLLVPPRPSGVCIEYLPYSR